jgi:hypothetical protein
VATNRAISPKQQEKKVKTAIVAMLLATALVSPASAEWDYSTIPCVGCVKFRDLTKEQPTNQSRSQTVIRSNYGTSTINSTYRFYSRSR